MRKKKGFKMTTGHFFFNIKAGHQNTITISRQTKAEAVRAFNDYKKQRKDCEWLGQWDGKNFTDTDITEAA